MKHLPEEMHGAADLHVHSSPEIVERRFDDIDLAREAARAGLSALIIKSHQNSTVERAALVSRIVPDLIVRGGLVLNETVGGLNPSAVRLALALDAREIWMPTKSARNHMLHHGELRQDEAGGISILQTGGGLKAEVDAILRLLADSQCLLGTGHLSPEEGTALIRRGRELGVRRFLVTHPEWRPTFYPVALQIELAAGGDVWFERCFVSTTHRCGFTPWSTIENAIADLGVETTVIATDLGQPDTPPPVEGLALYGERLRAAGFSPGDVRAMAVWNPRRLLDLTPEPGS